IPGIGYHSGVPVFHVGSSTDSELPAGISLSDTRPSREFCLLVDAHDPRSRPGHVIAGMPIVWIGPLASSEDVVAIEQIAHLICEISELLVADLGLPEIHHRMSESEFVSYLYHQSSGLSESQVRRAITQGIQLGMPSWQTKAGRAFHRILSTQWLMKNSP